MSYGLRRVQSETYAYRILSESEVTVNGVPVPCPSNSDAVAVRVINNNASKKASVGLAATVDIDSVPPVGFVLGEFESIIQVVRANSNEIYVDAQTVFAVPSGTITYGAPTNGSTVILTNLPSESGVITFTKVAAAPGPNEFTTADELAALINALTDLDAVNVAGTITLTVKRGGAGMNSATITGTDSYSALSITFSGGVSTKVTTQILGV